MSVYVFNAKSSFRIINECDSHILKNDNVLAFSTKEEEKKNEILVIKLNY